MSQHTITYLCDRIRQLEDGIRKHRDAKGHDRCFENNIELYKLLPEGLPSDYKTDLPCKEEFLKGCEKYHNEESRTKTTIFRETGLDKGFVESWDKSKIDWSKLPPNTPYNFGGNTPVVHPYRMENRYQDSDWAFCKLFDDKDAAIQHAKECARDSIAYGMTRIIDNNFGTIIAEFPAGYKGE